MILRHVLQAENTGIDQFEIEQDIGRVTRFAFQHQLDLVIGLRQRLGIHIDGNRNIRALCLGAERGGRIGVFKGQVLDILGQSIQRG